jgi:formate dehydrogenase major subunit
MTVLNVTINGKAMEVTEGTTILQAADAAGIVIPTLCHHPALKDIGACRMCLVQIENMPALQPACTYPVTDGIKVETHTPRTQQMRKFVLEMLFSERNHYCMFCEMSGDCELQKQAYDHGLAHWTYPTPNPKLPVDASRTYFLMDHNRCILCRRCIRACGDVVANHTLGMMSRGARTMVTADMDEPFGDSSCVSCGTCLQVCPTGALVDRRSAYGGRNKDVDTVNSACTFCSVGCRVNVITRNGRPLRVEGDWDGHNEGVLCLTGRFQPLETGKRRVTSPLVKRNGALEPATWDEALAAVAKGVQAAVPEKIHAWVTSAALDQPLDAVVETFRGKFGGDVRTLEGTPPPGETPNGGALKDLDNADLVLVVDSDPLTDHRVLGYRIKRAADNGAKVLVCADGDNEMADFAHEIFPLSKLDWALASVSTADRPVVVYRAATDPHVRAKLAAIKSVCIPLHAAVNAPRAINLGLGGESDDEAEALYILLEEQTLTPAQRAQADKAPFVVMHACYVEDVEGLADVVLPAPLWYEREGTFHNIEGKNERVRPAAAPPEGVWSEPSVLQQLSLRV